MISLSLSLTSAVVQRRPLLQQVKDIVATGEGLVLDVAAAYQRNAIWEDTARTTLASVDGPVGSIQDELERYYFEQATTAAKPILRTDGAGHYWLEADGVDDSLSTPDVPELRYGTTSFTLAVSLNPDNVTGFHGVFSKRGTGGPGIRPGWGFRQSDSHLVAEYDFTENSVGPIYTTVPNAFAAGQWSNSMLTLDRPAGQFVGYTDGVAGTPVDVPVGDITGAQPLVLGSAATETYFFDGLITRVLCVDRLLTSGELSIINAWLDSGHP